MELTGPPPKALRASLRQKGCTALMVQPVPSTGRNACVCSPKGGSVLVKLRHRSEEYSGSSECFPISATRELQGQSGF